MRQLLCIAFYIRRARNVVSWCLRRNHSQQCSLEIAWLTEGEVAVPLDWSVDAPAAAACTTIQYMI